MALVSVRYARLVTVSTTVVDVVPAAARVARLASASAVVRAATTITVRRSRTTSIEVRMSGSMFAVGDDAEVTATFRTAAGAVVAPGTVSAVVTRPDGSTVTLTYPATLTSPSTGVYRAVIDCTMAGRWSVRWVSTGAGKAAVESAFTVKA